MSITFTNVPTQFVNVNSEGKVINRFSVTAATVSKSFPVRNGQPVIGPNVRRIMTIREILAAGLATSKNKAGEMQRETPELCLVPLKETKIAA